MLDNRIHQKSEKINIETRIANRLKSIFAAGGQVVNDFYLEIGIYCIGLFNAGLVSWDIYTTLLRDNQPLAYAIIIAFIALVAVEGLAVYLVGAAAKTNNGLLWFFSIVFAAFFTFAHYQEGQDPGVISHYIMLAIPFFVVIGYWARTIKVDIEIEQIDLANERISSATRQQQIEDEERQRKQQIEDEERRARLELQRIETEQKHQEKLARIEASKGVQKSVKLGVQPTVKGLTPEDVKNAVSEAEKPINITKLADSLQVSRTTLYSRLNSLVDSGEMIKNGNGYEVIK